MQPTPDHVEHRTVCGRCGAEMFYDPARAGTDRPEWRPVERISTDPDQCPDLEAGVMLNDGHHPVTVFGPELRSDDGVVYDAFIGPNGEVGYLATREADGRRQAIYLNASGCSDDGVPTVFVYLERDGAPTLEAAWVHFEMFTRKNGSPL